MSRKLRIEYPRAMYHAMNRGDQREDILQDDEDRQRCLSTLARRLRQATAMKGSVPESGRRG
jgi:hypothetical protein